MAFPEVEIEVEDGALGSIPDSPANVHVKLGVVPGLVAQQLYSFSTPTALRNAGGQGVTVEAGCASLAVAGGPLLVMPLNPSQDGSTSAIVFTGVGVGVLTANKAPAQLITVEVTTAGTQAAGTIRVREKLGAGSFSAPHAIATSGSILVPGTFTKLTYTDGTGFDVGDKFTIDTVGVITQTVDAGAGTGSISAQTSSPLDNYDVKATIVATGAPGTGTFNYSLDGGTNTSETITIPGTGKYVIEGTGVWLNFSGTFTAIDFYTFTTLTAGFNNTDVTNALVALRALTEIQWGFVHIVGTPSSAANSASLAAVVDAQMVAAATEFRYAYGTVECPQSESAATIIAAFASFSSVRTEVCVGDFAHVSVITGRTTRRNSAWAETARVSKISVGTAPSRVKDGAISQVGTLLVGSTPTSLFLSSGDAELLHDARFTVLRTLTGKQGVYIANGNIMAPAGSDFSRIQRRRVMDEACRITRLAELDFLNDDVRVDPTTGFIDERDAQSFEAVVNGQLVAALVTPGDAVSSTVRVDRTVNLLSTSEQPVEVRVVPKAYFETITTTIGFNNPALAVAA